MGNEKIVLGIILGMFFTWVAFKIYIWAHELDKKYKQVQKEKSELDEKSFYKDLRIRDLEEKISTRRNEKNGKLRRKRH